MTGDVWADIEQRQRNARRWALTAMVLAVISIALSIVRLFL